MIKYTVHIEGFEFLDHSPLTPLISDGWFSDRFHAEQTKERLQEIFEHIPADKRPRVFLKQESTKAATPLVYFG